MLSLMSSFQIRCCNRDPPYSLCFHSYLYMCFVIHWHFYDIYSHSQLKIRCLGHITCRNPCIASFQTLKIILLFPRWLPPRLVLQHRPHSSQPGLHPVSPGHLVRQEWTERRRLHHRVYSLPSRPYYWLHRGQQAGTVQARHYCRPLNSRPVSISTL